MPNQIAGMVRRAVLVEIARRTNQSQLHATEPRKPKDVGPANRTRPRGSDDCATASASTASPSAKIQLARSRPVRPLSVKARRREVRWNSVAPIRVSRRPTALEIVALESPSSADARANAPISATLAKIAHASKSNCCSDRASPSPDHNRRSQ